MDKYDNQEVILPLPDYNLMNYDIPTQFDINAAMATPESSLQFKKYIIENLTQIHCLKADKIIKGKGKSYRNIHIFRPFCLFTETVYKLIISKAPDEILSDIIKMLEESYYIRIKLDQYYLPGYSAYNKKHLLHTEYIYGFNLKKQELYLYGHLNLNEGGISTTSIHFDDFKMSYKSSLKNKKLIRLNLCRVKAIPFYHIDPNKVKTGIAQYYNSILPIKIRIGSQLKKPLFSWDLFIHHDYGLNVNLTLQRLLEWEYTHYDNEEEYVFSKYIQAIIDFKNIMSMRLELLSVENSISPHAKQFQIIYNNYKTLTNDFNQMKNMYIKYNILNDKKILKNMINLLDVLHDKETYLLRDLLRIM